jgi:lysophospholipase L1-like esterase
LLIGDSLAVGLSAEFMSLTKNAGYISKTHTIIGSTTLQWLRLIKNDLRDNHPSVVFISLGTNDIAAKCCLKKFLDAYKKMSTFVTDTNATLIWIGPPTLTDRFTNAVTIRESISSSTKFYFASHELDIPQHDGIHSSADGYKVWMNEIWRWTIRVKAIKE